MLQSTTLEFLRSLKRHNNREWFEKNRGRYEVARADFEDFTAAMITGLAKVQPAYGTLKVKDCVFRIYRDVRFSKNKAPYKTNMGAYFTPGGKKSVQAGFYIQVEPGHSFIAGGCWMPQAPELKAIRQEIDYNLPAFEKILNEKSFRKYFDGLSDARLKTTPKGYDASNPAIDHLRQTSFIVEMPLSDTELLSKNLVRKNVEVFRAMNPFLEFLNTAIS